MFRFRVLVQQFSKSLLEHIHKDAFAVFRAPHKVVVQREHRPSVDSVAIDHQLQSNPMFDIC